MSQLPMMFLTYHHSDGEESNHDDDGYRRKEEYGYMDNGMEFNLEFFDNEVWKVIQNGNSQKRISTGLSMVCSSTLPVAGRDSMLLNG
ncbi:hypothetical protein Tco_0109437 [Tanacetum coccineum]